VEDCCFAINRDSVLPNHNLNKLNNNDDFVGVISLQSTTISDFHDGLLGGINSIINCDKSSFINMRGTAMKIL
jgi:hypothetical protein